MSRSILWFGLTLSIVMLGFGLLNFNNAKPLVFLFWIIIGVGAAYKLFGKKSGTQPAR